MKKIQLSDKLCWVLIAVSLILSVFFYTHFPERVPTHWDINGNPNGYSSAAFGAFFFPGLIVAIYLLLTFIPYLDPRREHYGEFGRTYGIFKAYITLFMVLVFALAGISGIGFGIPIGIIVPAMVGVLMIILGNYFGKVKSNWFVGIRNPWTLSSEEVWNKSHRFSGWVFVISGLVMLISSFMPAMAKLVLFGISIAALIIIPNVYSYILFRRYKMSQSTQ